MSEKPIPEDEKPATPEPPVSQPDPAADEEQIEEFITRHILEKDTVFFEG